MSRFREFTAPDPHARATAAATAGLRAPFARGVGEVLEAIVVSDPDPRVRLAALGALVRAAGTARVGRAWRAAAVALDPALRRRAAELAPVVPSPARRQMLALLGDEDPSVAEAAASALGEIQWSDSSRARVVGALSTAATDQPDALVREAAVAALGALGDTRGLHAILTACRDRPAVRRRAVLALAPFVGPDVDAALHAALTDPDWQVRQAAEDLTA